ncbi:MarR family transcriptional regulator [Sneathiella marina]|uniref:MarR family transcriptional regulator n=1 Tax=Sneathiella marina TaxID=2950108 RepID=A0ABY4W3E7_9PROT|nr:MarR family transcriptional regulator [Sneathiella marina]USG61722.1 MarR family transcriptional regulator [Sneathiella marina]
MNEDAIVVGNDQTKELTLSSLDKIVGFHMRKAILKALSRVSKVAGRNLATGQYSVMAIIDENPGRTQSAIAEAAGLDRSSLVPILNQFEKNGFITRVPATNDKRAYSVSLTDDGRQELKDLDVMIREIEMNVIRGLGEKDHQQLIDLLKRYHSII